MANCSNFIRCSLHIYWLWPYVCLDNAHIKMDKINQYFWQEKRLIDNENDNSYGGSDQSDACLNLVVETTTTTTATKSAPAMRSQGNNNGSKNIIYKSPKYTWTCRHMCSTVIYEHTTTYIYTYQSKQLSTTSLWSRQVRTREWQRKNNIQKK